MEKDTVKILEELKLCDEFKTFYDENKNYIVTENLSKMLNDLIIEKNLKKSKVITDSEIAETYAYQIFSGLRIPERNKLLCLGIAMKLNIDEMQKLLKSAGYAPLYAKKLFDSIVLFGICKEYSVIQINELLYKFGLDTIG